ncbi:Arsenical pump membrane protein [Nocardioides aquaticus]|uniref:Arsenical pump membrane protein n=3 Tax=Nocardioides aquaticus TaxID=160826 RepID=A0ABX8ER49_9ACTN|nr:SLC13 family permease [Nocardioides aquaticus]QVT82007.1 Arsenical pump membrane protein [Nocardioides aquaticus]
MRRRSAPLWLLSALAGVVVVATGVLAPASAEAVLVRVGPVLVFLVALTLLAELCESAGLFDLAADLAARLAGGRTWLLFGVVVALATTTTVLLSLDTTAVLLTPVVLTLCARLGLPPLPFAMATVWLANTASLLLPVSNLTNLLALRTLDLHPAEYAARAAAPAAAAVVATVVVLAVRHRRELRGRYVVPAPRPVEDAVLLAAALVAVLAFATAVLAGADVAVAAVLAAAALAVVAGVRRRALPSRGTWSRALPWRLVLTVTGLFLVVAAADEHGLGRVTAAVAGEGGGFTDLLRLAATSAGAANLVNNLPAYLALEPAAGDSVPRLLAVLVGVNAGPLVLVWGSLATLLWRERCRARGLEVTARSFAASGLVLVPVVLVASVAALALVGGGVGGGVGGVGGAGGGG